MLKIKLLLISLLFSVISDLALGNEKVVQTDVQRTETSSVEKRFHGALGLGGVWNTRELAREYSFSQFSPELVAYGYSPLSSAFWLWHSLRFSYAWMQAEGAKAMQILENDWKLIAETGLVWSWVVVPSLSVGFGSILRSTSAKISGPIENKNSQIGGISLLPVLQVQLGLGIPIEKGLVVLEPYIRHLIVLGDHRYHWTLGTEATISVF